MNQPYTPYQGNYIAKPEKRYLPIHRVNYIHILRGPEFKVWKPFASAAIVVPSAFILFIGLIFTLLILISIFYGPASSTVSGYSEQSITTLGLIEFVSGNLMLACFIPLVMISTWAIHKVKPGFVSSVVGKFRWKFFAWCVLVITPIWGLNFLTTIVLNNLFGYDEFKVNVDNPSLVGVFILLVFLTTPLQAAGEEYLLRGWMLQQIGAFIKDKYIAVLIAGLSSAIIFSALHLNPNPIALIFYFNLSVATIIMTFKTGGLEAAAVLHIVHNIYVYHLMIFVQNNIERTLFSALGAVFINLIVDFIFLVIVTTAVIYLAKATHTSEEFVPDQTEVDLYNQQQQQYLQALYQQQYSQYLKELEYYNAYQDYVKKYYEYYYNQS